MKSEEREVLEELNQQGFNLKEEENTYSRFDAFNDNYIVEIKNRSKVNSDTFIEFDKYSYNLTYSKIKPNPDYVDLIALMDFFSKINKIIPLFIRNLFT